PDAKVLVVAQRVLQALDANGTAHADLLGLRGAAALLGEEGLRIGLGAEGGGAPALVVGDAIGGAHGCLIGCRGDRRRGVGRSAMRVLHMMVLLPARVFRDRPLARRWWSGRLQSRSARSRVSSSQSGCLGSSRS